MALTRPLKEGNATTYQGKVALGYKDILASEVDADLDTIYGAWNGTLGGDLTGTLPTPTLTAAAKSKWTVSGATLTPTDATKIVAIPGGTGTDQTAVQFGTRTQKGRLMSLPTSDSVSLTLNRRFNGSAWVRDDMGQPSWTLSLNGPADSVFLSHETAAGAASSLLTLDNAGNLTVSGAGHIFGGTGGTTKGGLTWNSVDQVHLQMNNYFAPQDAAKASWNFGLRNDTLQARISYRAASTAAGTETQFLMLDNNGNLQISGSNAVKASGTTWANPSDRRLKDEITDYTTGLAAVLALSPRTFLYNGKGGSAAGMRGYGYIADEAGDVIPEMLGTTQAKLNADDEEETEIQTLDTSNVTLALVNAVKELAARVAALEAHA